jgi:hypothetical protein
VTCCTREKYLSNTQGNRSFCTDITLRMEGGTRLGFRETGETYYRATIYLEHFPHFRQQYHNSKFVIFQERLLKVLKCYNFLSVQRRHNCSPAESFANRVMTLQLVKVHLQTFISIPITQKYQILICDSLVANQRYDHAEK